MGRQSRNASRVSPVEPRPPARAMLAVIGVGSAIAGALGLASAVAGTAGRLGATSLQVDDVPLGNAGIAPFSDEMGTATARYSTVSIELQDAPAEVVHLDAWATAVQSLPLLLLSIMLCWLCWSATKGRPFAKTSPWMLGASGITIVLLDLAGSILEGRVLAAAMRAIGGGSAGDAGNGPIEGIAAGSSYGGAFLGIGVLLIVLSAIFALGSGMQRDTEKLV